VVEVFVSTTPEIKRIILRLMEEPVKQLDVNSTEILNLLDTFPKGGENFISRMIHFMSEKSEFNACVSD
jgi:hypothetical protein